MSDIKKEGLGLFINKKSAKSAPSPLSAPRSAVGPKNVQKRWVYVSVGVIGIVVVSSSIFSGNNQLQSTGPKKVAPMVNVNPPNADKAAFESRFAKDLADMRSDQEQMKAELLTKDRQITALKDGSKIAAPLPAGIVAPPSPPGSNTGGLASVGASSPPAPPAPPVLPVRATAGAPTSSLPSLPGVLPSLSGASMSPPQLANPEALVFDAPPSPSSASDKAANSAPSKLKYKKNESAGVLPAGSFAAVALLNGVDAGTSTATQTNPMPLLFNITDQATLPGAAKYKLKNCFVLGTAYGDMSAERVYGRVSRLSCVDKADRLVLSQEVQGYLVDSDGKLGLRGVISDRQGAKLGNALLAGFAQGLSGALGQAQGSTLQNSTTGTTTNSITGTAALRSAGLTGAQSAAGQLAEFYLKEASNLFPVITVDAGRTGTIVFSNSVALNWTDADSQYVQQVTPTNN